jgi:Tol biopolymer transport system component
VQPLSGSKGKRITNFASNDIASFHWSPDGKSLVMVRSSSTSDVILLRDSSGQPK